MILEYKKVPCTFKARPEHIQDGIHLIKTQESMYENTETAKLCDSVTLAAITNNQHCIYYP